MFCNVTPQTAGFYVRDQRLVNAILGRKSSVQRPTFVNRKYLSVRQLAVAVLLTSGSFVVVRLTRERGLHASTLDTHVRHVRGVVAQKQVLGVEAGRIVTPMQDMEVPRIYNEQPVGESVSAPQSSFNINAAITGRLPSLRVLPASACRKQASRKKKRLNLGKSSSVIGPLHSPTAYNSYVAAPVDEFGASP